MFTADRSLIGLCWAGRITSLSKAFILQRTLFFLPKVSPLFMDLDVASLTWLPNLSATEFRSWCSVSTYCLEAEGFGPVTAIFLCPVCDFPILASTNSYEQNSILNDLYRLRITRKLKKVYFTLTAKALKFRINLC